ncbi:MAG: efflux RND transporter periplasmic adaptor subunit [Gammaproteobacteria bacterium]|nr:efflux RND transporter periplasmic adaptor subunit [Gammaproteobacteria bacterium]MCY4281979.1 efflux RND transporter periplasmic adaptor subunit [Gammaproteobacteria bacterium]
MGLIRASAPTLLSVLLLVSPLMPAAQEAVAVQTAPVKDLARYPWQSAPATVVSLNDAAVAAQLKARIVEIPVKVGEVVEAGSVLARLDCTDYRIAEQRVKADLAALTARIRLAARRLERTRKLERQQTASAELLDQREADLAVLQAQQRGALAQLEAARVDLSRCAVNSPYRAVVTGRLAAVGEFADFGTELVHIIDIERLEISAQVSVGDIDTLKQSEQVYFEDSSGRYALTVRALTPTVNTQTRNREVRLLFDREPALPGAAGKLIWRDYRPHLSARLLVRRDTAFGIFLNDNGTARFHALADAQQGRNTPVDLTPDTVVVTAGHHSLQDGQQLLPHDRQ